MVKSGEVVTLGLHGSHYSTVDAKGRVSVPVRLRAPLLGPEGTEIMVTVQRDPCILVYPPAVWQALAQQLRSASPFDDDATRRKRMLFGNASGCPVDKQGRVLLPQPLRDLVDLGKDVIWLGVDDHAEIWDRSRWEAVLRGGER